MISVENMKGGNLIALHIKIRIRLQTRSKRPTDADNAAAVTDGRGW